MYYSTGNKGNEPEQNTYEGSLNQRYNPENDVWEVMVPCPNPTTDGSGEKWNNELYVIGSWNINLNFYNREKENYNGPVKKLHLMYNYDSNNWHFEYKLPRHWHLGGARASKDSLWRFVGTIEEDIYIRSRNPRSNMIFRWNGMIWIEMKEAPVRKMNFGTIFTTLGPNFQ